MSLLQSYCKMRVKLPPFPFWPSLGGLGIPQLWVLLTLGLGGRGDAIAPSPLAACCIHISLFFPLITKKKSKYLSFLLLLMLLLFDNLLS